MTYISTDTPIPPRGTASDELPVQYFGSATFVRDLATVINGHYDIGANSEQFPSGVERFPGFTSVVHGVGNFLYNKDGEIGWPGRQDQTSSGITDMTPPAAQAPSTSRALRIRRYMFKLDDYLNVIRDGSEIGIGPDGRRTVGGDTLELVHAPNLYLRASWNQLVPEDSHRPVPRDPRSWDYPTQYTAPDPNTADPQGVPGEQILACSVVVYPDGYDPSTQLDTTLGFVSATTYRGMVGEVQSTGVGALFSWHRMVVDNYTMNDISPYITYYAIDPTTYSQTWLWGDNAGGWDQVYAPPTTQPPFGPNGDERRNAAQMYYDGAWRQIVWDPGESGGFPWPKQGDIRTEPHPAGAVPPDYLPFPDQNKNYDFADPSDPIPDRANHFHPALPFNSRPGVVKGGRDYGATYASVINDGDPVPAGCVVGPVWYAYQPVYPSLTPEWVAKRNCFGRGLTTVDGAVSDWVPAVMTPAVLASRNVWLAVTYRFIGTPADVASNADAPQVSLHYVQKLVLPPPVASVAAGHPATGIV